MRWDRLFCDLEAQLEAEQQHDFLLEVADRTRRERAAIGLHERFIASTGSTVQVRVAGAGTVPGQVSEVGADWVLLEHLGRSLLVPFPAVLSVTGLTGRVSATGVARRFTFGYALRGLSRDRAAVLLTDVAGTVTSGTVDAVGADALELSEHPADLPRRAANVTGRRVIPFAAVALLRSAQQGG